MTYTEIERGGTPESVAAAPAAAIAHVASARPRLTPRAVTAHELRSTPHRYYDAEIASWIHGLASDAAASPRATRGNRHAPRRGCALPHLLARRPAERRL